MLLHDLEESRRSLVLSLVPHVHQYSAKRSRRGLPPIDREIQHYEGDPIFHAYKAKVINYYLALSVATLRVVSDEQHMDSNFKYDRCMSAHEAFICKKLVEEYGSPVVRQLLIGSSHADIYIPALHFCIEPSSERYFATPARSRAESKVDLERFRMNKLRVWHTEDYYRTTKNLDGLIWSLINERPPRSPKEIQENYFIMACHTIPRFIPYSAFCSLLKNSPE